jgi:glutathione S-transferase
MQSDTAWPVLYSFRRCPYAMRARLALVYSHIVVELREVVLRAKPAALLAISPKGTVPVLQTIDGQVIEQSLDIMQWALQQHDPDGWFMPVLLPQIQRLIAHNDGPFKAQLDRYKYPERDPSQTQAEHRAAGEAFLHQLDTLLGQHRFLLADQPCWADVAIFPFVRQFAHVDRGWFAAAPYPHLQQWLSYWCVSALFESVMQKYPAWQPDMQGVTFGAVHSG